MTHYFFDSSALIKRYVAEKGSLWIRTISAHPARNTLFIAQIAPVEVVSGISRQVREGNLVAKAEIVASSRLNFHLSSNHYKILMLSDDVVNDAISLLKKHPLRAYDAVQLASALIANSRLLASGMSPLIFLSADIRLSKVALAENLLADDPNQHP